MRVVVVDLVATSPFYCRPFTSALLERGVQAELASPIFYLEPGYVEACPRPPWIVDLVARRPEPRRLRLGLRAVELTTNLARLSLEILRGAYDVVHVQWVPVEAVGAPFLEVLHKSCRASGTLLAMTVHNPLPHDRPRADRIRMGEIYSKASLLFAHTPVVAEQLHEELQVSSPVTVVPHGPLFSDVYLTPSAEVSAQLGLDKGPVILYFGIVRPYKGLDLLASAWPAIRRELPSATLLVVGRPLGEIGARQVSHLRRMKGVQVVDRYVPITEMARYHAASDIVVFPYRYIAQSGAFMTAVALGRPTVITPITGLLEQSAELTSVVVAEGMSPKALSKAVVAAVAQREQLGVKANDDRLKLVRSERGWPAIAASSLKEYRKALERLAAAGRGAL